MSTIPDSLTRELCETLNLWDGGDYGIDAFRLVEDQLAPVIAKHTRTHDEIAELAFHTIIACHEQGITDPLQTAHAIAVALKLAEESA